MNIAHLLYCTNILYIYQYFIVIYTNEEKRNGRY